VDAIRILRPDYNQENDRGEGSKQGKLLYSDVKGIAMMNGIDYKVPEPPSFQG